MHAELRTVRFEEGGVLEQIEDGDEAATSCEHDVEEIGDRVVENADVFVVEAKQLLDGGFVLGVNVEGVGIKLVEFGRRHDGGAEMHDLVDRRFGFGCRNCGNEGREDCALDGAGVDASWAGVSGVVGLIGAGAEDGEEVLGELIFDESDGVGPRGDVKSLGSEPVHQEVGFKVGEDLKEEFAEIVDDGDVKHIGLEGPHAAEDETLEE